MKELPEWITGWKKIADYLDVSVRTAQRYCKKGMPTSNKLGTIRAKPQELDNFIKKQS